MGPTWMMAGHLENTIPAFKQAVKAGTELIELDVWLTRDREVGGRGEEAGREGGVITNKCVKRRRTMTTERWLASMLEDTQS